MPDRRAHLDRLNPIQPQSQIIPRNSFQDVLSTEDWALAMVGQPTLAVLFLFPVKPASEAHRHAERERIEAEGQVVTDKLFYMKQEIGNACGTVRLCVCGLPATVPTGSLRSSSPP